MCLFPIGGAKIEKISEAEHSSPVFMLIFVPRQIFETRKHISLMDRKTENHIILRNGSRIPFEPFFKEGFPKFFAFAGRFIADTFAQEDVVQEAFIEVWNHRNNYFEDMLSLEGYIYTFIKNKCIDHIRHYKVKEQFSNEQMQEKTSDDFLLQSIIDEETRFLIHQAVRQLTPQCRQVIQLHLEGKKIKEIAQEMGISEVTVKYHKAAAYRQLYKLLGPLFLTFIMSRKIF